MDFGRDITSQKLLSLKQAAEQLAVPVETLLKWNDYYILTPKITLTGEIGYTQEQINQFLTIQHTLQQPQEERDVVLPLPAQPAPLPPADVKATSSPLPLQKRISPLLFFSTLALSAAAFFLLATQQGKIVSLLAANEQTSQTKTAQVSHAQLAEQINGSQQPQPQNSTDNSLQSAPEGTFTKNIFAEITPTKAPQQPSTISNKKKQVLAASATAIVTSQQPKTPTITRQPTIAAAMQNAVTLANTAKQPQNPAPTGVQISDDGAKPNTLAMVLGAGSLLNPSPENTIDLKNQLIFLLVSTMILFMLLLRKQKQALAPALAQSAAVEKILEVHQKMDGTVFVSFQGKDYKISKPELDSDSDRFIERLMQLMQPGMKELEYESLTDTIRLTTPLSRIVTRLGFVGIKRDLFFPRTSKHAVLFRKYLTREDLLAMRISLTDLQKDLDHAY